MEGSLRAAPLQGALSPDATLLASCPHCPGGPRGGHDTPTLCPGVPMGLITGVLV